MKIKELREYFEGLVEELEGYDDDLEIKMVSNTYFLGNPLHFLGIAGYDGGYINLDAIDAYDPDEDEEEE